METLATLRRRVESAEALGSVVRTMKGLAAVNVRVYDRAAEALSAYFDTVEAGLQVLLQRAPVAWSAAADAPAAGRHVAVVFGTDQGMAGQFNTQIVEHALAAIGPRRDAVVVTAVGARLTGLLGAEGCSVDRQFGLPSSPEGIVRRAEELLTGLDAYRSDGGLAAVTLYHHRPLSGASYEPVTWQILPLDPGWLDALRSRDWPTHQLPAWAGDWETLLEHLIRQVLFVSLYRAFAHSLAAENASRLAAMEAAERNIEERLEQLTLQYHRRRQSSITEELLDVIAGFEVLQADGCP